MLLFQAQFASGWRMPLARRHSPYPPTAQTPYRHSWSLSSSPSLVRPSEAHSVSNQDNNKDEEIYLRKIKPVKSRSLREDWLLSWMSRSRESSRWSPDAGSYENAARVRARGSCGEYIPMPDWSSTGTLLFLPACLPLISSHLTAGLGWARFGLFDINESSLDHG